jgi:hypothetical protein
MRNINDSDCVRCRTEEIMQPSDLSHSVRPSVFSNGAHSAAATHAPSSMMEFQRSIAGGSVLSRGSYD